MMDEEIHVSVTAVEQLKAAGTDLSKQVPALLKLGEWYLKKAKTTSNCADFTKANALYNAALVRSRSVNHEIGEDQILRRIVETYREFLYAFAKDCGISVGEIQNEIDSHKKFLADERRIFKERVDEIDSCFNTNGKTEEHYEIHANQMHDVFRDIQDMYIRLMSMLAKECQSRLGQPPCDYAIIALGSVARMEATPFSDLEFAILYSDPAIGDKINYFRVLSHFLHLKVINLGETILPALAIEQLNDFQSSDPNSNWFYDSVTPRGISFDGAMPWASKTALGRMETKNKPALELIRTPEEMARLQDEEIAVKEGYHLADIMSRVALIFGDQALLNEYNERVAEKLNKISSAAKDQSTTTVGFVRGMEQLAMDVATYHPLFTYLGQHCTVGALFDAKKQFYRLISLLLSDLGLIFDIRYPSPWQVISELQTRGIISVSDSVHIKVCLSIANEIRLKTYFANDGQKELLSPVPQYKNTTEQSTDPPIFRYFDEDILVRLLSISDDFHRRCHLFYFKYIQQKEIDIGLLGNPTSDAHSKTTIGTLYFRLQDLPKALEWMQSESKDSPDYSVSFNGQGLIYNAYGEYEKGVRCFENALEIHYQNEENSHLRVLPCLNNLAMSLLLIGQYETARIMLEEAIKKHNEVYDGEGHETISLSQTMQTLGLVNHELGNMGLAIKTFKEVEKMLNRLKDVPDRYVILFALNIASSLSELDEHAQSLEYVEQALHLSKKLFGRADLSYVLAGIYIGAATVYEHCNRNDEALSWYKQSLELVQSVFGDNPHPGKVSCLNNLGNFFSRRYQTNKAVESLENALEQARNVYHTRPNITLALTLNNLGVALKRADRSEESLPYFKEGKEIMDQILGTNHAHPVTSDILNNMGTIYQDLGLLDRALQCYKDVHKMNSGIYGEDSASDAIATVCSNIACVSEELGDFVQAKEYYNKAVEIDRKISWTKNTSPGLVSSLYGLSSICEVLEQPEESLKHMEEAREVAKNAGSKNSMVATVLLELGMKYDEMERIDERKKCFQEAREIGESLAQEDSLSPSVLELLEVLKNLKT